MKATTLTVRHQPLPKLSVVSCANRRNLRGVAPTLRRKKNNARRVTA